MKLAICLFNYFPFGGLERNFIKISRECLARGHRVEVFSMRWEGEKPEGMVIHLLAPRGMSNHRQAASYAAALANRLSSHAYDLVLGFNRIPGLDLYYAADVCYAARIRRQRSFLAKLTPRYRIFSAFERAVFGPESRTEIIMLSENEKAIYQAEYRTPDERFHLVPPGVSKKHIRDSMTTENREKIRARLGLAATDNLLLMIGSSFHTKGVDRAMEALAALPLSLKTASHLCIIGKGREKPYLRLARKLSIADHVHFLGVSDDVPLYLSGADFVLQPSRTENTGNAIVEALVAGVPVLATEACGFAMHVARAGAGKIIPCSPFRQQTMNTMLQEMLLAPDRKEWQRQAIAYADSTDLYNRVPVIVDMIETLGAESRAGQTA